MRAQRGMTLIDVVIGTALVLVIFLGLSGILRVSIALSTLVKEQTGATEVANSQMEYIRSLSYDQVGTVGGIPSGVIAQNATTTMGGVTYGVRTFIDYYDDPADGSGVNDANGITTDYKRIKVTVSYTFQSKVHQVVLDSNYAPSGIETTANGGTLEVIVVNASGAAVSGASVHIVNTTSSPTVDLTTFTDSTGIVYLPGATPSTDYQIAITKNGYSTAQTYARDATNQNPTPGYLTVVKNQTTSSTFAIDQLGTLSVTTALPAVTNTWSDSFADSSSVSAQSGVTVGGGSVTLSGGAGSYGRSGSLTSVTISPSNLSSWGSVNATVTTDGNTGFVLHVLDGSGALLPDSVLPGNSTGFTTFPVSLSGVSTSAYPSLQLSATLSSNNVDETPVLSTWSVSSVSGPTPIPNVPYTLTGTKTIGSTGAGAPIYKTIVSTSSGASGTNSLSLEWDSYSVAVSGYDVVDACDAPPYALSPGASIHNTLLLGTQTTNSMLVTVTDSSGNLVPGASVTLSRSGYSETVTSSSCGTAYFGNLTASTDYTIGLVKTGYTTNTITGVTVSGGQTFYAASFL